MYNFESELYTVRFRHYSPGLGRWLERDPAGYINGANVVQYVSSRSVGILDPFGLCAADPPKEQQKKIKDYWKNWKEKHKGFTDKQLEDLYAMLQSGCIGVMSLEIGKSSRYELDNCYASLQDAQDRQKEMVKKCECENFKSWDGSPSNPRLFALHYYMKNSPTPDETTKKIDLSTWRKGPTPGGCIEYDFAIFDPESKKWIGANHQDNGGDMMVYYWDLDDFKKSYPDCQYLIAYCVVCEKWGKPIQCANPSPSDKKGK